MGETNYISTTAALLAEVLFRQGDFDEADEYTRICEELAAHEDVVSQFRYRSVASEDPGVAGAVRRRGDVSSRGSGIDPKMG
jgi:hypothetical protein